MKKTLLAFLLIAAVIFTNTMVFAAADTKFTDVSGHWAESAINKLTDKEIYADKDGRFQPDKAITRSEFVLMLHKELGININYFKATDIREFFDDVKNEDAYAGALYDLVTTGIVDDRGHFNPDKVLTREEMMHYVMNAYRYEMGDNYKMVKIISKPFLDNKQLNPSYSGEIARAENMGLIKRPLNNMFYPKTLATRAQAAVVIDRLLRQLEKENSTVFVIPGAEYKDGSLIMKLTITNNSKSQVIINHNSGQKFDFQLLDAGKNVLYTWSSDKMFAMIVGETVIEPGQSVDFTGEVEKAVLDGMKQKPAYLNAKIVGQSNGFSINPNGYEIEIK